MDSAITFQLLDIFKGKFGEQDAKFIVREFERIETSVAVKVDKKFEESRDVLATKKDLADLRADMEKGFKDNMKWMFIFWIGQLASFIAIAKFIFHQ